MIPEYNVVISIAANADEPGEDINYDILEYVLNSILDDETTTGTSDILLPLIGIAAVIMVVVAVAVIYVRRS
ncbi:unnamed protein product [marine sediment metagenome]|uniref:Uncharacterized protein n=1 Tax=marine sediment metagenome TaxID=412755 RepID=X1ENK4_9ZZZZ